MVEKVAAVDQMALKQDAVNRLLKVFGATFGGMAALRGVSHLASPYPTQESYLSHPTTTVLPLKIPVRRVQPKPQPSPDNFAQSMAKGAGFGSAVSGVISNTVDALKQKAMQARDMVAGQLPDIQTTHPLMNAVGIPLTAATALGGAYGGMRLADGIAKRRQRSVVQDSLGAAESEYKQELRRQFANRVKGAEVALEEQTKSAAGLHDVLAAMSGMGLTALAVPAAMSAMGGYAIGKGQTQPKALQKAIELRRRALQGQSPGLYAIAEPLAGTPDEV